MRWIRRSGSSSVAKTPGICIRSRTLVREEYRGRSADRISAFYKGGNRDQTYDHIARLGIAQTSIRTYRIDSNCIRRVKVRSSKEYFNRVFLVARITIGKVPVPALDVQSRGIKIHG